MDRETADRNILDKFCESFCEIVEKHCRYIVVSGFVAIASGRTRGTEDIDLIIELLDHSKFKLLFDDLIEHDFVCMQSEKAEEVFDYLKDGLSVRFIRKGRLLPEMEVKFAKDILDKYQIENRVRLELTGLNVWFSGINDNIAFKEELLKSPKDLEDAQHLRLVYPEQVDEEKIKGIKKLIREYRLK